jgi:hypothetical protein
MANEGTLDKVYDAIGRLRAQGVTNMNVTQVSKLSGISRATIYQKHADWDEVRAVIDGKPSPRVRLMEIAKVAEAESTGRITHLANQIGEFEKTIIALEQKAESAYKTLTDQLLYYATVASEVNKKRDDRAKTILSLNKTHEENLRLAAALREAQATIQSPITVAPVVSKKHISLPNEVAVEKVYDTFLDQLAELIPDAEAGSKVGSVYVLCGLPMSGKSHWIAEHKSHHPGVALYIESTSHTQYSRQRYVKRIREKTKAPIHCVRLRVDEETCSRRCNVQCAGAQKAIVERQIQKIAAAFEEVTVQEPFDAILLV